MEEKIRQFEIEANKVYQKNKAKGFAELLSAMFVGTIFTILAIVSTYQFCVFAMEGVDFSAHLSKIWNGIFGTLISESDVGYVKMFKGLSIAYLFVVIANFILVNILPIFYIKRKTKPIMESDNLKKAKIILGRAQWTPTGGFICFCVMAIIYFSFILMVLFYMSFFMLNTSVKSFSDILGCVFMFAFIVIVCAIITFVVYGLYLLVVSVVPTWCKAKTSFGELEDYVKKLQLQEDRIRRENERKKKEEQEKKKANQAKPPYVPNVGTGVPYGVPSTPEPPSGHRSCGISGSFCGMGSGR